jgi:hypothetical protein
MERVGIRDALSLDEHFRIYRFGAAKRNRFRMLVGPKT